MVIEGRPRAFRNTRDADQAGVALIYQELNLVPEFSQTATSSHPVMHDRSSPLPQPSLRANMLNIDGVTPGRIMGARILCTDCHNSDDNREFGGTGPNGPHGSRWPHVLERRYAAKVLGQAACFQNVHGQSFP